MKHHFRFALLMTAIIGMPCMASAQQPDAAPGTAPTANAPATGTGAPFGLPHLEAKDLSQYPSVLEFSGDAVGAAPHTEFRLRCGYMSNGKKMQLDPTSNDLSITNEAAHAYTRYQFIDGKPVVATLDTSKKTATGFAPVVFQVTEPDGSIKAKSCMLDLQTDVPQNCTDAKSFMPVEESKMTVQAVATQCFNLVGQEKDQISPRGFDAKKTQDWKASLHEHLAVIEK